MITPKEFVREKTCSYRDRERLTEIYQINIDKYSGIDKRKCLRNCVLPELGLHIFQEMLRNHQGLF